MAFGTTPATAFTVVSATRSRPRLRPAPGTVDITVTTPVGTISRHCGRPVHLPGPADGGRRHAGPRPDGRRHDGHRNRHRLHRGRHRGLRGRRRTHVTVNSTGTQLTATSPAGAAGTVDVTVTAPVGTSPPAPPTRSPTSLPPTVTAVTPSCRPPGRDHLVTITGTASRGPASQRHVVDFGTSSAVFHVNSATSITATSPAGTAGPVDVTVTSIGRHHATNGGRPVHLRGRPHRHRHQPGRRPRPVPPLSPSPAPASRAPASPRQRGRLRHHGRHRRHRQLRHLPHRHLPGRHRPRRRHRRPRRRHLGHLRRRPVHLRGRPHRHRRQPRRPARRRRHHRHHHRHRLHRHRLPAASSTSAPRPPPPSPSTRPPRSPPPPRPAPAPSTSPSPRRRHLAPPRRPTSSPTWPPHRHRRHPGRRRDRSTGGHHPCTASPAPASPAPPPSTFGPTAGHHLHRQLGHLPHRHLPGRHRPRSTSPSPPPAAPAPPSAADQFTYVAAPTVTAVSPGGRPVHRWHPVTITGHRLHRRHHGRRLRHHGRHQRHRQLGHLPHRHLPGRHRPGRRHRDHAGGTCATTAADQFTYVAAPTVTAVSPATGPPGRRHLRHRHRHRLLGTGFPNASVVDFGPTAATTFIRQLGHLPHRHLPGRHRHVDVTVTTAGGTCATSAPTSSPTRRHRS